MYWIGLDRIESVHVVGGMWSSSFFHCCHGYYCYCCLSWCNCRLLLPLLLLMPLLLLPLLLQVQPLLVLLLLL